MAKFYIETFGCKFNQADSELIRKVLVEKGYKEVSKNEADFVVINTCGVVEKTERKITKLSLKIRGSGKKVIFAGCLPRISPQISLEFSDGMIGPTNILDLPMVIEKVLKGKRATSIEPKLIDKASFCAFFRPKNTVISIIQIAEGCLLKCSYCATKLAKGNVKSFDKNHILNNVKLSLRQGSKEIQLTSQDLATYGGEIGKLLLPELLHEISKIDEEFRVRLGMMSPGFTMRILNEMLKIMEDDKFYKFFHLPVESGSNEILKAMRRNYKREECLSLIKKINEKFELNLISTDVIVGFPGESEKDFKETVELIKEIKPEILHIFRYSKREGTSSFSLKDFPDRVKKERSRILTELWLKIVSIENKKYVNKIFNALITEKKERNFLARLPNYKAVILKKGKLGEFVKIKITESKPNYLIGELIS